MTKSRSTVRRLTLALFLGVGGFLAVGCLLLSDRPEFPRCHSDLDCIPGVEQCEILVTVGQCLPIGFCDGDSWCQGAGPERCINERCTAVECTESEEEPCAPYLCGAGDACLTSCAHDWDCQSLDGAAHYCVAGACVEDQCDAGLCSGYDCTDHVCNTYCAVLAACASGYNCVDRVCQPP